MRFTVLLADDHPRYRQAIKLLLERDGNTIVIEASDGEEAVQLAAKHHPDLIILDVGMPVMNGIEAAGQIAGSSPLTRMIILSAHREPHYVFEALRAGVRGYVLKSVAGEELVPAIRQVAAGSIYLSPSLF